MPLLTHDKKKQVIERTKALLSDILFKNRHRIKSKFFTRERKLTFTLVMLLILQKSVKSLQLVLNEFFLKLGTVLVLVTASAYTQARNKLSHTAFIELNQKAIVETYYGDGIYQTYLGFRLVAVDGSRVRLPDEAAIREYFGTFKIANQHESTTGEYPVGVASVLYDVLNNIALDSIIAPSTAYEVDLAIEHLPHTKADDLVIFDRNYVSYRFLAELSQKEGTEFLGRCSRGSFKEAQMMFDEEIDSKIVTLRPPASKKKEIESLGLPVKIKVRFVRVILDTGEVEVLVTSLRDETRYPTKIFKELYHLRWGIETFYGTIKGRLELENFTGKTVESIKQDFYATIYISGLESIITADAQQELDQKTSANKYPQAVNKAVSFNAIKNHVIELFHKEEDTETILDKLTQLFKTNPICVRDDRKVPREKSNLRRLLNYHKRRKKICF